MPRSILATVVVVVLLSACASVARATDTTTRLSLLAAQDFWKEPVTCGDVHVVRRNDLGAWGAADPAGCIIYVATVLYTPYPGWSWNLHLFVCNTITHEIGHLLGHGHSADPNSIMLAVDGYFLRPTRQCAGLFAPRKRRFATR